MRQSAAEFPIPYQSGWQANGDYQAKGFFDNALSGKDIGKTNTFSSRAAVRWEPTQDFELNFNVHAGRDRSGKPSLGSDRHL